MTRTPNNAYYNTDKKLLDYQIILTRTPSTVKAALYDHIGTDRKWYIKSKITTSDVLIIQLA